MRLRRLWIVCAFLFVPAVVYADAHRAGGSAGGGGLSGSTLWGVHFTGDVTPIPNYYRLTAIGDFSVHTGKHEGVDVTAKTYLAGAGFALGPADTNYKHIPFVHALFGTVDTGGSDNPFAVAIGGGWEWVKHRDVSGFQLGIQAQYDFIFFPKDDDAENLHRFTGALVFRFKK
jgi:hypothetical protein